MWHEEWHPPGKDSPLSLRSSPVVSPSFSLPRLEQTCTRPLEGARGGKRVEGNPWGLPSAGLQEERGTRTCARAPPAGVCQTLSASEAGDTLSLSSRFLSSDIWSAQSGSRGLQPWLGEGTALRAPGSSNTDLLACYFFLLLGLE